ncbi:MAG: hypothetical protein KME26_00130 [Oscillatoria princeps RMCB-10]|jgi:hypothetical protein|nr:hypothetical protein [Oscillatoria princeps RMCB-10]
MTKTEILEALKQLTAQERLEIAETALRLMREEIQQKAKLKAQQEQRLAAAAEAALPDYMPGSALEDLWSPDSEDYYDSEDDYLSGGVEVNAQR